MDALRTVSTGFENAQNMNIQNARAAQQGTETPRERDDKDLRRSEQPSVTPSVQVNLSEAARAAAGAGLSSPSPVSVNAPAAPVQTQEAVVRAGSAGNTDRVEMQNATTASNREAVQRYMDNANNNRLPPGQSGPSTVRVSA